MRVLPHRIRRGMSEDAFRKAVRENFEAIFNLVRSTDSKLDRADSDSVTSEDVESVAEDAAGTVTDRLNEAGVGNPDGSAPTEAPTNVALTPGINYDIWVTWSNIANNSAVAYVVERATASTGPWTVIGETVSLPGDAQGSFQYHDTGLALNTNYYYRVKGKDGDGDGPYSAVAGPQQVNKTVNEQIADATIDLATKIQGLLPNVNLATISDPAKLAAAVVTAGKLAIGSINSSNLLVSDIIASNHLLAGSVVAGKIATDAIVAGNIQAGAITTEKMTANSINGDRISANTLTGGKIIAGTVTATELAANSVVADKIAANAIDGKTITGATIRTAAPTTGGVSNVRVEIAASARDSVKFIHSDGFGNDSLDADLKIANTADRTFTIRATRGPVFLQGVAGTGSHGIILNAVSTRSEGSISAAGGITADGRVTGNQVTCGGGTANPPAGHISIYESAGELRARNSSGVVRTLATF